MQAGQAHYYTECSGKGQCDRATGQCTCFDGYTGHACQRSACPNGCSGNGVCLPLAEVAQFALNKRDTASLDGKVLHSGVSRGFEYRLWDAKQRQACVCDAGFVGVDCSLRQCPRGDDPVTTGRHACGGDDCRQDVQTVQFLGADVVTASATSAKVTFALIHTHWDGEEYTSASRSVSLGSPTDEGATPSSLTAFVKQALLGLPNAAVTDISVTCTETPGGSDCTSSVDPNTNFVLDVTFRTPSGSVPQLRLALADATPGAAATYRTNSFIKVLDKPDSSNGNNERVECSNRGVCDYASGECSCFTGYTGPACSTQSALAKGASGGHQAAAQAAAAGSSGAAASSSGDASAASSAGAGDAGAESAAARERRRLQRKRARKRRR